MRLLFYGESANWIGCKEMSLTVEGSAPLEAVLESEPRLAPILANRNMLLVSVNYALSAFDAAVDDKAEVAFLPPFGDG
jgi:molybdopterin converting factor small subunit